MRKIGLLFALLTLSGCAATPQNPNLGEIKTDLKSYVSSGRYNQDFAAKMADAESYIVSHAKDTDHPAVVLDIDETSLSNMPQLLANDFSFFLPGPCTDIKKGPCGIKAWQQSQQAKSFPATRHLFEAALQNHIAIFFLTGRDETVRKSTEQNLRKAGYHDWTALVLRPAGTKTEFADQYKAPARAAIEAKGYHILATIGDQPSDLSGGYADKTFLIPNPFYRIP